MPAPPSIVSWVIGARPLAAVTESSPPSAVHEQLLGQRLHEPVRAGRGEADGRSNREDLQGVVCLRALRNRGVGPVAAVDQDGDQLRHRRLGRDPVVAAEAVDRQRVERGLGLGDRNRRGQPRDLGLARAGSDLDRVVAVAAVHDDPVGGGVAASALGAEVGVDPVDVGAGEVVDGDGVEAAEGLHVDRLDAGGVHRDRADVAGEAKPAAVCGQVELLADVGAVEEHGVGAVLALDDVAAVAGIPLEGVVACSHQRHVGAAVAVDEVVAVAAYQRLSAGATGERVVVFSAVERGRDAVGEDPVALVDAHEVVPASAIDRDARDVGALEAELGRAVVTDVDLERSRLAGLEAECDLVTRLAAFDHQHAVLERRVRPLAPIVRIAGGLAQGGPGRRDGVESATEGVQPRAGRLTRPLVLDEVVERMAMVSHLCPAISTTRGAQERHPCT